MAGTDQIDFFTLDFNMRLHLNCDVEGTSVNVTTQTGSAPVYDRVIGELPNPQPSVLAEIDWNTRILQVRAGGVVTTTHPNTYVFP
jgi:hypothetical protein